MNDKAEKIVKDLHDLDDIHGDPTIRTLAADLIASQQAEIERLTEENARLEADNARLTAQIEAERWTPVSGQMPESGTHVLLYCEIRPIRKKYVCDGYYAAPKTITCENSEDCACEYDDEKDEYFLLEGYYEVIKNWDDFGSISIDDFVTHWRPLPQPPKEAQS
jgi:hypothetical protein